MGEFESLGWIFPIQPEQFVETTIGEDAMDKLFQWYRFAGLVPDQWTERIRNTDAARVFPRDAGRKLTLDGGYRSRRVPALNVWGCHPFHGNKLQVSSQRFNKIDD